MNRHLVVSNPRPIKRLFFVPDTISWVQLETLIDRNINVWGGRYTPIVPVQDNKISDSYMEILKNSDPDIVFIAQNIDQEFIKDIPYLFPESYQECDLNNLHFREGNVSACTILNKAPKNSPVLVPFNLINHKHKLLKFYELNFGFKTHQNTLEAHLIESHNPISISYTDLDNLYSLITHWNAFIPNLEIQDEYYGDIFTSIEQTSSDQVEIVISKNDQSIDDLLFYWNRGLYENRKLLFCSSSELEELGKTRSLKALLFSLAISDKRQVRISSQSLTEEELSTIAENQLEKLKTGISFNLVSKPTFPYPIDNINRNTFQFNIDRQSKTSEIFNSGIVSINRPKFLESLDEHGAWMNDLQIFEKESHKDTRLKFPLTTNVSSICDINGRITKNRQISVLISPVHKNKNHFSINLGDKTREFEDLIGRPYIPYVNGISKTQFVRQSDDSKRLKSFVSLFKNNWSWIDQVFDDKFWLDLLTELASSNKMAGDTITFQSIISKIKKILPSQDIILQPRNQSYLNEQNLKKGVLNTLGDFCDHKIFLTGYKLKCPKCSSVHWYPISRVNQTIECSGCLEDFNFPVESILSYKLNSVILNNIMTLPKNPSGNLTVIRALSRIAMKSFEYFEFSPQLDLLENPDSDKPIGDLDLICNSNGRLIIGEAKNSSTLFLDGKKKSLDSLISVARRVYPDEIILVCSHDEHNKLEKAVKYVNHLLHNTPRKPQVNGLCLESPEYNFTGTQYFYF